MLHELLCGRHPGEAETRAVPWWTGALFEGLSRPSDAAAPRQGPPTPLQLERAGRRGTNPARLRRRLRGDLDTIVGRAMNKDPAARYPSVAAFAADIHLSLAHRPISARPDTLGYRLRKLLRRHWSAAVLAAVAALALLAGVGGTVSQARRATRAARVAEQQRGRADAEALAAREQRDFALRQLWRAEAMNELDAFLLVDAAPAGQSFTAGELLSRAERILQRQGGPADATRVEVSIAIGRLYRRNDDFSRARELLETAYARAQQLPDRALRAKAACALASVVTLTGGERAEALLREADALLPAQPQFTAHRIFCLLSGNEVAHDRDDGRLSLARIEAAQRLLAESPQTSPELQVTVAIEHAEALRYLGRPREAAPAFAAAFAQLRQVGRDSTKKAVALLNNWALCLQAMGQLRASERLFRQALAIDSPDGQPESGSANTLNNLAHTLFELGRLDEATRATTRAYREAVRIGHARLIANSLLLRASLRRVSGDLGGAQRLLAEADGRMQGMYRGNNIRLAVLASEKAQLAEMQGQLPAALRASDQAVQIAAATPRGSGGHLARFLRRRAQLQLRLGHLAAAQADVDAALAEHQRSVEPGPPSSELGHTLQVQARVLAARGRPAEAAAAAQAGARNLAAELGPWRRSGH
jgi:tetratricopeptide (TPR) repeat protein